MAMTKFPIDLFSLSTWRNHSQFEQIWHFEVGGAT